MKYFWTRFSVVYPRTLIYMLQGSDYRPKEYLAWLHRTANFRTVVKRKKLDRTKKARLLLVMAWLLLVGIYITGVALAILFVTWQNSMLLLSAIVLILTAPFLISYGIVIPLWIGGKMIQEPKQRKMVQSAQAVFTNHPGIKIAIAGSYGKTTAKEILRTVLAEGKRVAYTPGNMNTLIGISRFAQRLDGSEEVVIFELGEEKVGDVKELCELVRPDIGIITGINEAHLSSFGTLERTVATVFELQDYLEDKPLYKNFESDLVSAKIIGQDKRAFSRNGTNGWLVGEPKTDIHGTSFTIAKGKTVIRARTALLGKHNIGIIVAAVAIADSLGLSPEQIAAGIEKTIPFEHRMQPRNLQGAWVIDDTYNGNSQGVQVGLELLKELDAKRRIYVTPGLVEQGDKTREIHETIGRQIAEVADIVVLMKNSVTDFISDGLRVVDYQGKVLVIDNPLEFYTNLEHFVATGDVVLMQNDWTDNYA